MLRKDWNIERAQSLLNIFTDLTYFVFSGCPSLSGFHDHTSTCHSSILSQVLEVATTHGRCLISNYRVNEHTLSLVHTSFLAKIEYIKFLFCESFSKTGPLVFLIFFSSWHKVGLNKFAKHTNLVETSANPYFSWKETEGANSLEKFNLLYLNVIDLNLFLEVYWR